MAPKPRRPKAAPKPPRGGLGDIPAREFLTNTPDMPLVLAKKLSQTGDEKTRRAAVEALVAAAQQHLTQPDEGTAIYGKAWQNLSTAKKDEILELTVADKRSRGTFQLSDNERNVVEEAFGNYTPDSDSSEIKSIDLETQRKAVRSADGGIEWVDDVKPPVLQGTPEESQYMRRLDAKSKRITENRASLSESDSQSLDKANAALGELQRIRETTEQNLPADEVEEALKSNYQYSRANTAYSQIIKAKPHLDAFTDSSKGLAQTRMPPNPTDEQLAERGLIPKPRTRLNTEENLSDLIGSKPTKKFTPESRKSGRTVEFGARNQVEGIKKKGGTPKLLPVNKDKRLSAVTGELEKMDPTPTVLSDINTIDPSLGFLTKGGGAGTASQQAYSGNRALKQGDSKEESLLKMLLKAGGQQQVDYGTVSTGKEDFSLPQGKVAPKTIEGRPPVISQAALDIYFPPNRGKVLGLAPDNKSIIPMDMTPEQIAQALAYLANADIDPATLIPAIKLGLESRAPFDENTARKFPKAVEAEGQVYAGSKRRTQRLQDEARAALGDPNAEIPVSTGNAEAGSSFGFGEDIQIPELAPGQTTVDQTMRYVGALADEVAPPKQTKMVPRRTWTDVKYELGQITEAEYKAAKGLEGTQFVEVEEPTVVAPKAKVKKYPSREVNRPEEVSIPGFPSTKAATQKVLEKRGAENIGSLEKDRKLNPGFHKVLAGLLEPTVQEPFRGVDYRPDPSAKAVTEAQEKARVRNPNDTAAKSTVAEEIQEATDRFNSDERIQGQSELPFLAHKGRKPYSSVPADQNDELGKAFFDNLRDSLTAQTEIPKLQSEVAGMIGREPSPITTQNPYADQLWSQEGDYLPMQQMLANEQARAARAAAEAVPRYDTYSTEGTPLNKRLLDALLQPAPPTLRLPPPPNPNVY